MVKIVVSARALWFIGILFVIILGTGVYAVVNPGHSIGEIQSSCSGIITSSSGILGCVQTVDCDGSGQAITFDLNTNSFVCTTSP